MLFKNDPIESSKVNLYLIGGFLAGNIFTYLYYTKYPASKPAIAVSCICYLLSFILLYFLTGPDTGPGDLYLPLFLIGAGTFIAWCSLGIYLAYKIPPRHIFSLVVYYLTVRNFIGPALWGCAISNFYYRHQIRNVDLLASKMDKLNIYSDLASRNLFERVQLQASFLTIREIFGYIIFLGLAFFLIMLPIKFKHSSGEDNNMVMP